MSTDTLMPDWPAPAHVRALCTTRAGGVSRPPYASLNLGDHVGDDPAAVATNRARLRQQLEAGADTAVRPVFLSQVHGTQAVRLDAAVADGTPADACYTRQPGLACTIMVADCLPLLLTDAAGTVVAAAHAGWRGLAGASPVERGVGEGVIESLVRTLQQEAAVQPADLLAWLGPCIGPTAFEVGDEVRQAFVAHHAQAQACFRAATAPGKWWADLAGLARQRLQALGISQIHGNDSTVAWCTASQPDRFFSHRRDRVSGRMAACIWLAP